MVKNFLDKFLKNIITYSFFYLDMTQVIIMMLYD